MSGHKNLVYDETKEDRQGFHPTIKPLPVVMNLLWRTTLDNANVYDAFLGSGTTLIACEQLNRICYGIELEPKYIDVILDRYAKFTGDDPIREDSVKWSELKSSKVVK